MKLLRLALDKGAYEGESDNAAIMFICKLRDRNVTADDLFSHGPAQATKAIAKCGSEKMSFGKYRDEMIKNVPIDYLIWAIYNCHSMESNLKLAIHKFLTAQ